jgi:ribonucleoside-diphosphate reductase beta chain
MAYCLRGGPILGYSVHEHVETAKFFANMRLGSVDLPAPFEEAYHAFPWMSEQMELKKEKNFFETRVTEYQSGGALIFDDDPQSHDNPGWSDPLEAQP